MIELLVGMAVGGALMLIVGYALLLWMFRGMWR